MRAFAQAWPDGEFVQAVLAQLPWYHQLALLDKLQTAEERRWYAQQAMEHNWSRNILVMQIEVKAHARVGQAVTNFDLRLPKLQSDLARETLQATKPRTDQPLSCFASQPKNSPYQSLLLRGFSTQWFSSGNHTRRESTPRALSVL